MGHWIPAFAGMTAVVLAQARDTTAVSFPRKRESMAPLAQAERWIPACAGMTSVEKEAMRFMLTNATGGAGYRRRRALRLLG